MDKDNFRLLVTRWSESYDDYTTPPANNSKCTPRQRQAHLFFTLGSFDGVSLDEYDAGE